MNIFEVGEIITAAQQQCDKEGEDFIGPAEWKRMLHSVHAEHYSEIVNSGMRYYETTTTVAGSELEEDGNGGGRVKLPRDYMVHVGVDRKDGDRWIQLIELMQQERNFLTGASNNNAAYFAVIGQHLHVYPKPPTSSTMRLIYVPQPKNLRGADDKEEIDLVTPDGEMFVIWALCVMALAKEESDTRMAQGERDRFLERLREWAAYRSFNTPRRVQVGRDPHLDYGIADDPGNWRY